jgi:Rrf2 family protein
MPVLFSRACEYAIRGLLEMSKKDAKKSWNVQEVAAACEVPAPFLAKTLQLLVKAGILVSSKGRGGGFAFAKRPESIQLQEVVTAIDGPALFDDCVLGLPECGQENPCPFHDEWAGIRGSITEALSHRSLSALMR